MDQDPLGKQGWRVAQDLSNHCTAYEVWKKPLAGDEIGVVMWNRGDCGAQHALTLTWAMLSLPATQPMTAPERLPALASRSVVGLAAATKVAKTTTRARLQPVQTPNAQPRWRSMSSSLPAGRARPLL